ncbi:MAG: cadherin-like beta sandwich domain-containing protein, partial [Clostridiales bacterium]
MKKFLVVMLSLLMVFSFGSTVMAAGPTLTVAAGTDTVLNGDTYYYKAGASNASFNITGTFAVTSGNYYRLFTGTGTALGSAVYATTTATTTLAFTGIELATDATVELWQVDRDGTTKNGSALASCTVKVAKATANAAANALTPIGYRGGNVTTATVAAGGTLTLPATAHGDLTFTTPTLASGLTLKYQIGSVATAVTGNAVPYSVTDTKAIDETIKFWTVNQAGENSDGTVAATTITVKKPALAASLSSLKVTGLDTNGVYKNETDAITNDKAIAITTAGDAKACFTFAVPSGYGFAFKVDGKTVTSASSPQDVVLSDRNTTRVEIIVSKTNEATDTRTFPINLTMAKASVKDLYVEDDDDKDIDLYHKANSSSRQDRGFKTDIYKYYLAVDDAADALYLYPTLEKNKGFKLDVDYFKASAVNEDRNGNWEVLLNSKYDTITMTVSGKGYQSQDYTLNLNNAAGELDDLQVYSGKSTSNRDELNIFPGFNTDTSDYVAFLPYDRNDGGVTVEATANKKTDFLSINGVEKTSTSTTSFDQYIAIDDDDHEEIEIVAGDSTYTVTVYRAANKADEESALSTMDLYTAASTSSGNKIVLTSTSASSSAKKTYTAAVPLNQQYVWVSTRSKDSAAFVIVNGVVVNEQSSKTASTKVTLNKTGNTIITVVGMAEDCKTYEE